MIKKLRGDQNDTRVGHGNKNAWLKNDIISLKKGLKVNTSSMRINSCKLNV